MDSLGEIECVSLSHQWQRKFSLHDVNVCKHINLLGVVTNKTGNFRYADPTGKAPYIGRDWAYGIHDCYSLMRDFYKRELGIELDDFERGEEGEWESSSWTMFVDNYASQGFVEIDKPSKTGDFLLMNIVAPSPNHAGVFLAEQNCFYHHLMDRQSEDCLGPVLVEVHLTSLRHELAVMTTERRVEVKLLGELGRRFGRSYVFYVKSAREVISALSYQVKGFKEYLYTALKKPWGSGFSNDPQGMDYESADEL